MEHTAYTSAPPTLLGSGFAVTTGPVAGNGDLAVVTADLPDGVRLHIAKADLWKALEDDEDGGIKTLGTLDLPLPGLDPGTYHAEQRMDEAELHYRLVWSQGTAQIRVLVCATANILLVETTAPGCPVFALAQGNGCRTTCRAEDGMTVAHRIFDATELVWPTDAAAVYRRLPAPQGTWRYAVAVATNHEGPDCERAAMALAAAADWDALCAAHRAWWQAFWAQSGVRLDDAAVELSWYAGQYLIACCSRHPRFPMGLFGNFVTHDHAPWHGDYHLNYNYQAPFYPLCSSNHPELARNFPAPFTDFAPRARQFAREFLGCRGVYYPVGIGPRGFDTARRSFCVEHGELFLGQKSNAAYVAAVMSMIWYSTYDAAWAREHLYPFLRDVGDFWEDYLRFEGGRYVVHDDAAHEVPYYRRDFDQCSDADKGRARDFNNCLTLGLLRSAFATLLDMARELGVDADRRQRRQHILTHLSDYPTFVRQGKRVFRLTERGHEWEDGNNVGLQHVYPGGQGGLGSAPEYLQVARNTFFANDRWLDGNGTNSYFPCAARLGVDPELILTNLHRNYDRYLMPNLFSRNHLGCVENCGLTANVVNEMFLQGHEGTLRVFPVWNRARDAAFTTLRAYGAFLVSAQLQGGRLECVRIVSERGRRLRLHNPYPAGAAVQRDGGSRSIRREPVIDMQTSPGEEILIAGMA